MNNQNDSELIAAYVASADETVFTEIVTRHGPMVYRVCRGIVGDAHEAEDCSQAVFLVLVRKAKSLRRGVNLAAWLYSVARHVSLRAIEARHRRAKREKEATMLSNDEASNEATSPDQAALLARVYSELASLSAVQRQAVILRHLEARSEIEAASVAGCEPRTLAKRASDGVKKLRKCLARGGCALGLATLLGLLETEAHAAVPETLISSILTASQMSAAGAGAGAATVLAEGTMKMMMWTKIKMAATLVMACTIVGVGITFVGTGKTPTPRTGPQEVDQIGVKAEGEPAAKGKKENADPAAPAKAGVTADTIKLMAGKKWTLAAMKTNGNDFKLHKRKPYLTVTPEGRVSGSGSVNKFGSDLKAADGKLTWGRTMSSKMAAMDRELMRQEREFLRSITQTTSAEVSKGKLILSNENNKIVLTFTTPVP